MAESAPNPMETILHQCAAAAPEPWYPSAFARSSGVVRDSLDEPLNSLRLAGLIRITDWVKDQGQGYVLTPLGQQLLLSPRELARLKDGQVPQPKPEAPEQPPAEEATAFERGEAVRAALLGSGRPFVTQILLALNVVVFLGGIVVVQWQSGSDAASRFLWPGGDDDAARAVGRVLHETGGLVGADLLGNQWWRLLTTCFVHLGLIHLAVNMYALFALGPRGEQLWGRWRFLILYLLSGIAGSTAAMLGGPGTLAVGASGALCGLFAAEAVWLFLNRAHVPPALVSAWMRSLFLNAFMIAVVVPMVFKAVSNSAHLGGALGGLATAGLLQATRFGKRELRWLAMLGLAAFVPACIGLVLGAMNVDRSWVRVNFDVEVQQLNRQCLPAIDAVQQLGWRAYDEAAPLVHNSHPSRRDAGQVQKALAALGAAQTALERETDHLNQCGPYKLDAVERVRQRGLEVTTSFAELCRLAEHCLKDTSNYAEDEAAMSRQETLAREKQKAFRQARNQIAR